MPVEAITKSWHVVDNRDVAHDRLDSGVSLKIETCLCYTITSACPDELS